MNNVPDDLLLVFFTDAASSLLDLDAEGTITTTITDCRRCVLDQQRTVLKETIEIYQQNNQQQQHIDADQVQERLSGLKHESNLSHELKVAMEDMNDAARISICKLILYNEHEHEHEHEQQQQQQQQQSCEDLEETIPKISSSSSSSSQRKLQDEGRLDRTKLMEYFGLCQASLKLECVVKFMNGETKSLFEGKGKLNKNKNEISSMFPQNRLEYVQQLLAKAMGWDPVYVTSELRQILVEKKKNDDGYYNKEVFILFQQLVEQMTVAIQSASIHIQYKQETKLLNDLDKGGNTRVVSVQHSEFDILSDGTKTSSKNNAPERFSQEERNDDFPSINNITEEEKKRQLRLATDAAMLQQTILGELFNMDEHERNNKLKEAAEISKEFMEQVLALSPGSERIDFLRGIDPITSRQLAIHKLWTGMVQANGGQQPQMATKI
jgi:hypothetical protein